MFIGFNLSVGSPLRQARRKWRLSNDMNEPFKIFSTSLCGNCASQVPVHAREGIEGGVSTS